MSCKRCNGNGLPQHKTICGGVCFACGALPAGEKASPAFVASARERVIGHLATIIRRAAQETQDGTAREWWIDVRDELRLRLAVAPEDVRTRAIAAFAKLGLVP